MDEHQWLAEQFEANREHLQGVAYRMLGSLTEANDAVQECWLRLNRTDANEVDNLGGWLTTVVARISLDMLRVRKAQHEDSLDAAEQERLPNRESGNDPEQEAVLADSVGLALLVILDTLTPAERLAFVLHDIFAVSFEEIAPIVDRSEAATRKLASRARRRIQGSDVEKANNLDDQRELVEAFLTAAREGSFNALLAVLDPDVVLRGDAVAMAAGGLNEVRGASAVGKFFSGRARGARIALVDGSVGLVVAPYGRLFLVLNLTLKDGKIAEFEAVADPARLHQMHFSMLS